MTIILLKILRKPNNRLVFSDRYARNKTSTTMDRVAPRFIIVHDVLYLKGGKVRLLVACNTIAYAFCACVNTHSYYFWAFTFNISMAATPQIQLNILHCTLSHNERDGRISQRCGVQLCRPRTRLNCFFLILFISCLVVVCIRFLLFSLISYWARRTCPWVDGSVYSVVRTKGRKVYVCTFKAAYVIMPQKTG